MNGQVIVKIDDLLTQEEVDKLEVGTKVLITWSGGNGPHEYKISPKDDYDKKYDIARADNVYKDIIDHVGSKRWQTHVSLVQ